MVLYFCADPTLYVAAPAELAQRVTRRADDHMETRRFMTVPFAVGPRRAKHEGEHIPECSPLSSAIRGDGRVTATLVRAQGSARSPLSRASRSGIFLAARASS